MTFAVRALSATGDYTFGRGAQNFLRDSPAAVAQAALTRLLLWQGEWFLDLLDGTPWWQDILAQKNIGLAGAVIEARILGTPFAQSIDGYDAIYDSATRTFTVLGTLNTAFGSIQFSFPLKFNPNGGGNLFVIGGNPLGVGGGPIG
jgi:hypothetical protein